MPIITIKSETHTIAHQTRSIQRQAYQATVIDELKETSNLYRSRVYILSRLVTSRIIIVGQHVA